MESIPISAIMDHLANAADGAWVDWVAVRITSALALVALHQAGVIVAPASSRCSHAALGLLHHNGED